MSLTKSAPRTTRVEIQFLADRNFPAGVARIPEHLIHDFNELLTQAQVRYPTYTHEALMRYIWVKGLDNVRATLRIKQLPPPDHTPKPRLDANTGSSKVKPAQYLAEP